MPDPRPTHSIPRILVVEDQLDNRQLAVKVLRRAGFEVQEADRAEGLSELLRVEPPDLILMDIELPGQNGFDAIRLLKADPATASIPIVAVTAYAMHGDRQKCLDAGCVDYLSKPLEIEQLVRTVRGHLEDVRVGR